MLVHFGTETMRPEWDKAVVCIGTFDGVHLGHRAVISAAVKEASEEEMPCVLVTFDRHPAAILAPERKPASVATLEKNLEIFNELNVSTCLVLPFNKEFSLLSAQQFHDQILVDVLRADQIVIGHDFAMGTDREGTTDWLKKRVRTTVIPPFQLNGQRVSSSDVRASVEEGDIEHANQLLGRPFSIGGVVVAGKKLGRTLGFPTINLARTDDQVTPQKGIYAAACKTSFGKFIAAVSIGTNPAAGGGDLTIEAHLLDFPSRSLYGEFVELLFHSRLREERDFPDLDALKTQIAADVEKVATMPILERP